MNRKEFLQQLGVGATLALTGMCFHRCTFDNLSDVDILLDLTAPENAELLNDGGFVVVDGVVVAKTSYGEFVAATRTCSHDAYEAIFFSYRDEFECNRHGARFDLKGNGLNTFSSNGLTIYNIERMGTTLRVFS